MRRVVEQPISFFISCLFFVFLLICFNRTLGAQVAEPRVSVPKLKYLDQLPYVYTVGQQFKVNVDYSSLSGTQGLKLRARIFRGTYDYLTREIERRVVGGCISYLTTVLQPSEYNGGIHFGLNFDESWLHPNGTSILSEEHYVLVFEIDGPAGRWLDLERESVELYFRQGFFFTVRPDHSVTPKEAKRLVAQMREQTRQFDEALAKRQASAAAPTAGLTPTSAPEPSTKDKIRCRKVRLETQASSNLPIFDPVVCSADNKSNKRKNWFSRLAGANQQREGSAASSGEGSMGE